ncbi:MAG TPA: hypothetical protein VFQ15_01110 [Jiangellaceae bacterium]|nr:hypothetical protein [Jiangellaceae bacterium]
MPVPDGLVGQPVASLAPAPEPEPLLSRAASAGHPGGAVPPPPQQMSLLAGLRERKDREREDAPAAALLGVPGFIIMGVAAVLVLIATVVAASVIGGDADAGGGGQAPAAAQGTGGSELAAEAVIEVPGTAPDSSDNAGNPVSYSATNLVDGDPTTAWRMRGDASGAELILTWPDARTITDVGLINGYAKLDAVGDDDRYGQNRRVLGVTWVFDDGTQVTQQLAEVQDMQRLTLEAPVTTSSVRLRLDDVSRPGGRDYTALSELTVSGR